ncbi:MAG TPA: mycothiol synthase [Nocardioidaceae bacterium]|nr:mycothiol synthase [Nocardioidaceae bacterium]
MTPPVTPVDTSAVDWSAGGGPGAALRRVLDAATAADGVAPLDEAALLALRHGPGSSRLWTADGEGFAWLHGTSLDLVVAPGSRGRGLGAALATAATTTPGAMTAWSHGNHPAAAALAAHFGFERVRDLWVMRRPLADLPPLPSRAADRDGVVVRPFRVGRDEDAFLAVNAEAFASHPEQGSVDRADLDLRMAEPWFDPEGFLVAERDGQLVGFHWTKVHAAAGGAAAFGEVYVVGVSPSAQGGGLGRRLTLAGLEHLASRGLDEVILYVEADNAPAVATYRRVGFTHAEHDTHVQYARR